MRIRERTGWSSAWSATSAARVACLCALLAAGCGGLTSDRASARRCEAGYGDLPIVVAGPVHTCTQRRGAPIVCWGSDLKGNLEPPRDLEAIDFALGPVSCALTPARMLRCWGAATYRDLLQVPTAAVTQASFGHDSACAIIDDGRILCWGDGAPAVPPDRFLQLDGGSEHFCGVTLDGSISCWGDNARGAAAPPGGQFVQVTAGAWHSCALAASGEVTCWGDAAEDRLTPPKHRFLEISATTFGTCGLTIDGQIACWGRPLSDPPTGRCFAKVSGGGAHACAVRLDGTAVCWGVDRNGLNSVPLELR